MTQHQNREHFHRKRENCVLKSNPNVKIQFVYTGKHECLHVHPTPEINIENNCVRPCKYYNIIYILRTFKFSETTKKIKLQKKNIPPHQNNVLQYELIYQYVFVFIQFILHIT